MSCLGEDCLQTLCFAARYTGFELTKFGIVGMFQIHFIDAASARLAYLSQQLLGGGGVWLIFFIRQSGHFLGLVVWAHYFRAEQFLPDRTF